VNKIVHPLEHGTWVKVQGRKFDFMISSAIEQNGELAGYRCLGPKGRMRAIRKEDITKVVNKT
jgi:hypothetical protein